MNVDLLTSNKLHASVYVSSFDVPSPANDSELIREATVIKVRESANFTQEIEMGKTIHKASFAYGIGFAALLACGFGAAKNEEIRGHKYDVAPAFAGMGLYIVDHDLDRLSVYKREKQGAGLAYELIETIDLSLTGQTSIPVDKND